MGSLKYKVKQLLSEKKGFGIFNQTDINLWGEEITQTALIKVVGTIY
jgi:hypothetical protein